MHAVYNITNKDMPIMLLNLGGQEQYCSMRLEIAKRLLDSLQQCIAAAELVESQSTSTNKQILKIKKN